MSIEDPNIGTKKLTNEQIEQAIRRSSTIMHDDKARIDELRNRLLTVDHDKIVETSQKQNLESEFVSESFESPIGLSPVSVKRKNQQL